MMTFFPDYFCINEGVINERVVLVSEEFARKVGIRRIIMQLYRDPAVSDTVFVAIVKGSTEELITGDYPDKPGITTFLNDLPHPRTTTAFSPFTKIHDFIFHMTEEVSDPVVPYLEKKEGYVEISKVALFKEDKMIGEMTPEEAKIVQGLDRRKRLPDFLLEINKGKDTEEKASIILSFGEPLQLNQRF
jgi:spore germination protein